MSRTLPACPQRPLVKVQPESWTIHGVTPIFGGGAEVAINDPVTPIRLSSIRGHLRFWWRATRGAKFESPAQLREAEGKIWGTPDEPSKVVIHVELLDRGKAEDCASYAQGSKFSKFRPAYPSYALFPFQRRQDKKEALVKAVTGVRFQLCAECPRDLKDDVEAAVWAWVNFGGLGARTRRGCGALYCGELAPQGEMDLGAWLGDARKRYEFSAEPKPRPWPVIGSGPRVLLRFASPLDAWKAAVQLMADFRQGPNLGRDPGSKLPGRSRWPESDSLRAITGRGSSYHKKTNTLEGLKANPAFPRAALGLPIVFHFKSEDVGENIELSPQGYTRMGSPVVLRPLAVAPDKAVPMVLRLHSPRPQELTLKVDGEMHRLGESSIVRKEFSGYGNSPMAKSKTGSALLAFLEYVKSQGYKEVSP